MAMIKCGEGHYYDADRFQSCPYCAPATTGSAAFDDEKTCRLDIQADEATARFGDLSDEKTASIFTQSAKANPVVGWLVCTGGPERGRDYRLIAGRNFAGRSWSMSVCIMEDQSISREKHAAIIFEPHKAEFMIMGGQGTYTAVNGELVSGVVNLKNGDEISLGNSTFELVAYCREGKTWAE